MTMSFSVFRLPVYFKDSNMLCDMKKNESEKARLNEGGEDKAGSRRGNVGRCRWRRWRSVA